MAFQIPNQQQYMPQVQPQDEDLLGGSKLTPMDPLQDQLIKQILSALSEQPPIAPPPTKLPKSQRFLNAFRTDANVAKTQQNAQMADPAYREYMQKMQAYKGRQGALGSTGLTGLAAAGIRADQAGDREARLREQFDFRQRMAAQFKPETRNEYDVNTGTNRFHTYYRDPMRNNQVVYDEWSDYAPIHQMQYAGEGGEPVTFPTSPMPTQPIPSIAPPISGASAGAPGITAMPRLTEGALQSQGAAPSNVLQRPGLPKRGVAHQAPAGLAEQATRQSKFLGGLAGAYSTIDAAHTAQVNRFGESFLGMIGQVAQDKLAQERYGRAFVSKFGDPEVADYYNKIRLSVYDYVKAQTGAQFSITEMDRYLSSFPTSIDDPETAKNLIREHAERAVREINTLKLNWHSIKVGNQNIYVQPGFLDEFLRTGGVPQEVQPTDEAEAILQKYLERKRARQ